ncbi:MAG: enoyl-ACP reductase [Firmicutes bacterium]|nr:enoyl-ACP reductase [Alicyclobacillaceae bacterium]MCL6497613.1 enoyl-ACP reductase [Bacillota bacterium]
MGLLEGTVALVTGIANKRSMAWGIAQAFDREGARLVLTYQHQRFRENLEELVPELGQTPALIELDVASDGSIAALGTWLAQQCADGIQCVVHSIAYAERHDLEGRFVDTSREGFLTAQNISAYSLVALSRMAAPLLAKAGGGAILTLTHLGSTRVMPNYNVMGTAKASLESAVRYLAYELGRDRIRVNAISAGPVKTLAASGVRGISQALRMTEERAPIPENITTQDVGNAAVFLASPWATHITGQILFVDSGFHILGA